MHFFKTCSAFFLVLSIGIINSSAQIPKVRCGSLVRLEHIGSGFAPSRHIDVWLPTGYSEKIRYPVVYMHDGNALYDSSIMWNHQAWDVDDVIGKLIGAGTIRPCIVIGIWNAGPERHSEYCPQKPFQTFSKALQDSLYMEKRKDGSVIFNSKIRSDAYLQFLVTELKPRIDSMFSTLPDRQNTLIAGSSMGGIVSLYAISEYPEIFGAAACLSTHWTILYRKTDNPFPKALFSYFQNHLPDPASHRLYFDLGTGTLDSLYAGYQSEMNEILKQKGYDEKNSMTRTFPGAIHSEKTWHDRLEIPITFLLKKTGN